MDRPVTLPLWALLLLIAFAAVTAASHLLFPSVRWVLRRRMERVVARLNTRLTRPIEPFKLTRRPDTIARLVHDPEVSAAILEHARETGVREDVAFQRAHRYAREIVPSFSASLYFGLGTRLARWLSRMLYDIRLQGDLDGTLRALPADATVVFVMNHRSNMDYVLVTWLLSGASSLSYAVGEWARAWPLSPLVRMMGGYFIRRRDRGTLYRRVLARYVQMATAGGVTQALFPEGGLSLDGHLGAPRLGIIAYLAAPDPRQGRPVVFVPVAINYDRVLEDRILVEAGEGRRFRIPWGRIVAATLQLFWRRLTGRRGGRAEARVVLGAPLTLAEWQRSEPPAGPDDRGANVAGLGAALMARVAARVPALAVPLAARVLTGPAPPRDRAGLAAAIGDARDRLCAAGVPVAEGSPEALATRALALLETRGLVRQDLGPAADAGAVLSYYAASIAHHPAPVDAATPRRAETPRARPLSFATESFPEGTDVVASLRE